jgi:hypothetical protein
MAGATDPSIAAALEDQAKAIKGQAKALDSTQKLLQQICDRFTEQDKRWCALESSVAANTSNLAALHLKFDDSEIEAFRADLTRSLENQVGVHVTGLESATWDRMDAFTADASTRLAAIESVQAVFDSWRPRMEASVDNINTSMGAMRAELTKISRLLERGALEDSTTAPGVLGPHGPTVKRPPAPAHYADGPIGRGLPPLSREHGHGVVYTSNHLPADGMFHSPSCNSVEHLPRQFAPEGQEPPYHQFPHLHFGGRAHDTQFSPYLGNLPKLNFPTFDGLNPTLWQARCEDYFHMYGVDPLVWIQVATMQFFGPAARWLQWVKPRLATTSWEDFGRLLKDRFGKDEHALLLRQLFQLKQSGSVSEYIEHFAQLTDQLNAYQTVSDPLWPAG